MKFIQKLYFAGITVAYALSPIDLVPDFIPLLGYLDDVILLPMLVALIIKLVPSEVLEKIADKQKVCGKMESLRSGIMLFQL